MEEDNLSCEVVAKNIQADISTLEEILGVQKTLFQFMVYFINGPLMII